MEVKKIGTKRGMSDLISRKESIQAIKNLMESPYANDTHFGAERKETMEVVKVMCIQNLPTAFHLENVIGQLEELEKWNNDRENCKFTEGYACAIDNALEILKSAQNATNQEK